MLREFSFYALMLLLITAWLNCIFWMVNQAFADDDKIPLTVTAVCMNAVLDKQANLQTFFSYMEEASTKGAYLIVFPEIALQQNPGWGRSWYQPTQQELDYLNNTAEPIPGDSTGKLVDKTKELNIYVVFGMTEKSPDGDALYNASVFLGPNGVIEKYRKINLWDSATGGNEHRCWKRGTETGVFDSPIGKIGLIICADMFHYLGPTLAKEGADLLVTVSAWPSFIGGTYETCTKGNSSQAQRWHIVSNQVGSVGHTTGYGHSRIIDPNGNIIADTGANEGMVIAETDLLIDATLVDVSPLQSTAATWATLRIN